VVLKLQNRIKNSFDDIKKKQGQLLIYGQKGHAEVIGLLGQTQNEAIVISGEDELEKIDYTKPIVLYSQTTKSTKGFYNLKKKIEEKINKVNGEVSSDFFDANDSICRQVSNREPQLEKFSKEFDVIIFVSGKKSSNGKALFNVCKSINPRSYFIEDESELQPEWFTGVSRVGIAGATSTPVWLMEKVRDKILSDFNNK
jgi:4-hydroxy-3-methylbut-2-enyl diphosphate reductase